MQSRWARVARGASAATFATVIAAFSHTIAGGVAPSVFAIVVSLAVSISACVLLAGRTLSVVRLSLSVAITQALFHGVFGSLNTPAALGHSHAASASMNATGISAGHANMWFAHAVAAVITIVAFRYGERAFWSLATTASLLVRRVTGAASAVSIATPRFVATVGAQHVSPALGHVLSTLRYRGPPLMHASR